MATAVPNDTAFAEPEPIAEPQEPEDLLPIAGAGLGLLALAGLGMVVRRRRSRAEVIEEETIEPAHTAVAPKPMPVEAETVTPERSAFAWGNAPQADQPTGTRANETWAERAYHGPTPDNPSLSLKKRLKRAAFFDQRERDAAAGHAAPVEADAGLPDDMTNERALEAA